MCGIAGWLGSKLAKQILVRLADAMMHRGQDDAGVWVEEGVEMALAQAWRTLPEMGAQRRWQMGMAGRERLPTECSVEAVGQAYWTLYEEVGQEWRRTWI